MYDDILKIIEGGMDNNSQKVINYSKNLADYFEQNELSNLAKKINKIVNEKNTRLSSLDSLTSKPIDRNSQMDMVTVKIPYESDEKLMFNPIIEEEIMNFTKSFYKRNELIKLGINVNSNLLLYGKPGTGKSSLADFISLQTGLPLVTARLDGMVSSLLGDTAKNIRRIFDFASKQPCVLFLDEFDVIAKSREDRNELGELKRVVNSLLQNIDAFDSNSILIAATNHEQLLDSAVWRRFDKVLELPLPDVEIRKKLILHISSIRENDYVNDAKKISTLVSATENMSPSIIKSIFNNAFKKSVIDEKKTQSFIGVLYEIVLFDNKKNLNQVEMMKYLYEYGVTQKDLAIEFDMTIRKVRTAILEKEMIT